MPTVRPIPEIYLFPSAWEDEYRKTRRAREWESEWPEQFGDEHTGKRKPGMLQYFAQYALMYLLRRDHGIQSITWLQIGQVDRRTRRRVAKGQDWEQASPGLSDKQARTQTHWDLMRAKMGGHNFNRLQESIVRAGFSGHTGEPDLFCYKGEDWFFAEAKTTTDRIRATQDKWFEIARALPGVNYPVYVCLLKPDAHSLPT